MEYCIKLIYKGHAVEIKPYPIIPSIFIDDVPTWSHEFLNNKQFVCTLYDSYLDELRKTPKDYFKNLDFDSLVSALHLIIEAEIFLKRLRGLNLKYSYSSSIAQDTSEKCRQVVKTTIDIDYNTLEKFSDPQNYILDVVSNGYTGRKISSYDFDELYSPLDDSEIALNNKLTEFYSFKFFPYISIADSQSVLDRVTEYFKGTQQSIALFRKMRDIAGNDVVNWGPHKWASQVKKQGLKDSDYRAKNWLLRDYRNNLLENGIAPKIVKTSDISALKDKLVEYLSQEELVKLFKTSSNTKEYVSKMTATTAASLLVMTTKNVLSKLIKTNSWHENSYSSEPDLKAIVNKISEGTYPEEFKILINFLKKYGLLPEATWNLFINHVGHFNIEDFVSFAKDSVRFGDMTLTESFFNTVLSVIPDHLQYTIHPSVTDAFLRYKADDKEKISFLRDSTIHDDIKISYLLSHDLFSHLPYNIIKNYLILDSDGDTRTSAVHYLDHIMQNKDVVSVQAILIEGDTDLQYNVPYNLYKLLSFEEKIEVLKNTKRGCSEINQIFNDSEWFDFQRIAFLDNRLYKYIPDTPLDDINKSIKVADVTARLLDTPIYIPPSEILVNILDNDNIRRVIARGTFEVRDSFLTVLFNKLTRNELIDILGPLTVHQDRMYLANHMTPDELVECCDQNVKFFRKHVSLVPKEYIKQFKDKNKFKEAVGDCRNSRNARFAMTLNTILAAI